LILALINMRSFYKEVLFRRQKNFLHALAKYGSTFLLLLLLGAGTIPDDPGLLQPWQAQWIWFDEELPSDVMLARQTFALASLPSNAWLRITASSQYQLYINGKYVRRGPARSAPHHQSFDDLDIMGYLQTGLNTLAVRVHRQKDKFSYHHRGRGGLLCQLDYEIDGQTSTIATDDSWKVLPDPSWDSNAPKISRFQQVVNDRVDFRKYPSGWQFESFDDSDWENATPLKRKVGWPNQQPNDPAHALTPPWTSLVPREVPYLIEMEMRAEKLIEAIHLEGLPTSKPANTFLPVHPVPLTGQIEKKVAKSFQKHLQSDKALIIPAKEEGTWFLLFDFGKVLNGFPQLVVSGEAGSRMEIITAPFNVHGQFAANIVDSDFRDQIVLSGNTDTWESTYFKPTRYLGLAIRNPIGDLAIEQIGIRYLSYPFERRGFIRSPEAPWIETYMDASARTIEVCTTDGYTDNYRERRQYAQTGYYAALGNYFTFGDHALQRRYLIQTAQEQQANGIMPAYAPAASADYMIILDSNCLWIRSFWNYFLYSGDRETVQQLLPAARKLMALLHSYTDDLGLINNPPYPYWLDHARIDRRGANFALNGHYLGALEAFARLLEELGEEEAGEFRTQAEQLRQSLHDHFWDAEKGLFADALIDDQRSDRFSEHANALALALKVADMGQAYQMVEQLLAEDGHNYMQRESGMTMVTPAMSYFLHQGLCHYGYIDQSLALFRSRFDKMLEPQGNGTLWEEWWLDGTGRSGKFQGGRTRSDAQTESAFPPALFAEYLLGVKPTKPGMKEILFFRPNTRLKEMAGEIPSPEGMLSVAWQEDEEYHLTVRLTIPGEMKVKVDLQSLMGEEGQDIFVNGEMNSLEEAHVVLSAGTHTLSSRN
jgi:alpha-L-rhamnosidase